MLKPVRQTEKQKTRTEYVCLFSEPLRSEASNWTCLMVNDFISHHAALQCIVINTVRSQTKGESTGRSQFGPTVSEANTEPLLLHAEVGGKGQLHHVSRRVQSQPVGRQTAELNLVVPRVHHHLVVDAARRFLQVKVQEGELDDVPGRRLQSPLAGLRVGVFLGVAGRRDPPLVLRQHLVTVRRPAAQHWR